MKRFLLCLLAALALLVAPRALAENDGDCV